MSKEKREEIEAILAGGDIQFHATHRGQVTRDDGWECDAWQTVFTRQTAGKPESIVFDYFTGLGHRKPIKGAPKDKGSPNTLYREQWEKRYLRPVAPHAADVLYSLILDASACEMSFRDWCANYGYDNDSIKALNTYNACCESGEKLRRFFTTNQLADMTHTLEDY